MHGTDCYQLEELEPRLLLSADWNGVFEAEALDGSVWEPAAVEVEALGVDGRAGESVLQFSSGSDFAAEVVRREVVFVDAAVPDYQILVDDLLNSADDGREIEVVMLSGDDDGVEQITRTLGEFQDLDAIHISHSRPTLIAA